ncbi:GntR family transcriptional regulator [Amycolatopsis australiensis]|uniref:DNA-binding transcriptional regulator, GntR family n=1 Tax=Amycolatopsis australiensis TaxID=546364 RepID=A0A1K1R4I5_9PSEU|nr:GntR family transcriptional regulator [Amycolatopsis australiensis]SFW67138.1 DNA-binding transcriptional regulator, GntR family [Amycolatopsis australiensis]
MSVDASGLSGERHQLERSGTAERVAAILRQYITDGVFAPGERLSEPVISAALGVSRNTLRESFQLLAHERLAVHELNRGVFVRQVTAADIEDLYVVRRATECGALRRAAELSTVDLSAVERALRDGRAAAETGDWPAVGTASIHFHQALADLAGSERISATMRQVLAETRLFFVLAEDTREFYEPFLDCHERILACLRRGRFAAAEAALDRYLRDAEARLLDLSS